RAELEEAELYRRLSGNQRRLLGLGLSRPAEEFRDPREVLLEHLEHRRGVERCGGVVDRVEQNAPAAERDLLLLAVDACDPELLAREELRREVAERRDELWLDELDLFEEMGLAGLDLIRHGVTVPGRPALDHVGDVDVLAGHADPAQELVEQLSRLADEREALLVLVEARRLADEHQVGLRVADPEDDLGPAFREPAARAGGGLRRVRL